MTEQQLNEQRGDIAALLKSQRQYLQLTQEELAERAGFSPRTIQRFERGDMWIGMNQFVQYCAALEINIAHLMRRQLKNLGKENNAKLSQDRPQRL